MGTFAFRNLNLVFLLAVIAPISVAAEDAPTPTIGGHAFIGGFSSPGESMRPSLGGGAALNLRGFTVGGDVGSFGGSPFVSFGGSYDIPQSGNSKTVPFVSGGLTLVSSDSPVLVHFGGGVNYWMTKRTGLRVELRDHVFIDAGRHIPSIRVGMTFRY